MDILAKRNDQKRNLGPGEPVEIAKALARSYYDGLHSQRFEIYKPYPPIGGDPQLVGHIRNFLQKNGYPYKGHIVVTNGAKQALLASLYALKGCIGHLSHWGPYWPTLRSIAELSGHNRIHVGEGTGIFSIVTSPNNPDGRQMKPHWVDDGRGGHHHFGYIWDAAYASPAYGWNGVPVPSYAKVFSMAKLFGVPGLRVGWALFNKEEHAEAARAYVEVTTSGVNNHAQQAEAAAILSYFGKPENFARFNADVVRRLGANRALLSNALFKYVDNAGSEDGMYFWCLVKRGHWAKFKRALKTLDIGHVPGASCGAPWPNFYRFNLAQDFEVVRETAYVLEQELRK